MPAKGEEDGLRGRLDEVVSRDLSTELSMMAYRLCPEHPKPIAFKEAVLSRWAISVYRVIHGPVILRVTNVFLPAYWCGVVAWLMQQTTSKGLYHSLSDANVAFAITYDTAFLMSHRKEILSYIREAITLAKEIEELMVPSEKMERDIKSTVRLVQFIFGMGAFHAFAMLFLFTVPTLWVGESPSPLVQRNTFPPYIQYPMYLYQDFNVFVGDTCFMLIEYVHVGTTLASSLMYRMLAARFASETLRERQLRQLVALHQRLIDNTRAVQAQLSMATLVVISCAIMGLVMSTLSIMRKASVFYMYLVLPSTAGYIAIKCAVADELLTWSRELANAVYACPWPGTSRNFCETVSLLIIRAQRPQFVVARYLGHLDLPVASSIFQRWYSLVQYLSNY